MASREFDETPQGEESSSEDQRIPKTDAIARSSISESSPSPVIPGYRILRELNRGGQGIVYQAVQESTRRKVALKVMLRGEFSHADHKRRFEREIALAGSLRHPNIVPVLDGGEVQGQSYFAMEYIRGDSLDEYVKQNSLSVQDTLGLFSQLCGAVDYAHQKGIIHRDLKPSNILVDSRGEPHVLDFGLAKAAGNQISESVVSMSGQVIGTLAYLSPEQAAGQPDEVDMRSDVYSLGVILFQVLTNQFPYDVKGSVPEVCRRIAESEPTRASKLTSHVNDELDTIVLKCLAKEKDRRYYTSGALRHDIERLLKGEPIEAKRDSLLYVLRKTLRRYRVPAAIASAFVVLLFVSSIALSFLWSSEKNARHEAELARSAAELAEERLTRANYNARMAAAYQAWDQGNADELVKLLEDAESGNATDLRGFEWHYLSQLAQRRGGRKIRFQQPVKSLAFSPDSSQLAIGLYDGTVTLADVRSGRIGESLLDGVDVSEPLLNSDRIIRCLAFSHDSKLLAAVGGFPSLPSFSRMWQLPQLASHPAKWQHSRMLLSVSFSPDDSKVATAGWDAIVKVWSVASGSLIQEFPGHTSYIECVEFSPTDNNVLASGATDGMVGLWDLEAAAVTQWLGHDSAVLWVAFSPDGNFLAAATENGVRFWDVSSPTAKRLDKNLVAGIRTNSVTFSADGDLIITGSSDKSVRVLRFPSGEQVHRYLHDRFVETVRCSPDGQLIASGSRDGTVIIRDLQEIETSLKFGLEFDRQRVQLFETRKVDVAPDGRAMAIARNGVWLLDCESLDAKQLTKDNARAVAFSADGNRLAISAGQRLRVYDLATGAVEFDEATGFTRSIAFSSANPSVLFANGRLWNIVSRESQAIETNSTQVYDARFSHDGKLIYIACGTHERPGEVQIWNVESPIPRKVNAFRVNAMPTTLALDASGTRLSAGDHEGDISVWDLPSGELRFRHRGHAELVTSMQFSVDDKTLVTAGANTVRYWDADSGDQRGLMNQPGVMAIRFLANDHSLAVLSHDGLRLLKRDFHER